MEGGRLHPAVPRLHREQPGGAATAAGEGGRPQEGQQPWHQRAHAHDEEEPARDGGDVHVKGNFMPRQNFIEEGWYGKYT